ncbi:hypothetical protein CF327_g3669 [Tilletia walkeri]|nr:hypothetical protein CF327_g3669 [Tilletia walkeri]
MPNFTSVKEVADFLDHTMLDLASKRSDRFQIFAIVFGSAILTTLSLLVIHKVYYEDWWIFRLVSRGHNSIVLPNVHATWIVFISLYGWIRIGFSIVKHIGHVRHEPVPHKIHWTATMWTPACFAAWYQAWAITAARGSSVPPLEEATLGRSKGRHTLLPSCRAQRVPDPVAINHFAAAIASLVAGTASAFAMMNAQFETKFTALLQAWHVDKDTCQDRASKFLEME